MTQYEKLLIYALAEMTATKEQSSPKDVIERWKTESNKLWPRTTEKGEVAPTIPQEDIDAIYKAYPTKDPNNGNRRVGKSASDKERIRRLLENGHTKEELLELIKRTTEDGHWLKDLGTWLNNLPDFSEHETPQPKKEKQYRLRW